MAVGITILSGARCGEELGLDQPEFRAGDDPACELFFDPQREPGAAGREALFRLGDDGWYVKSVRGAALLVNHQPVGTTARLRSGDVVRFSPDGPEFAFKLLARLPVAAASVTAERKTQQQTGGEPKARLRDWRMLAAVAAGTALALLTVFLVVRQPAPSVDTNTVSTTEAQAKTLPTEAASADLAVTEVVESSAPVTTAAAATAAVP